MLVHREHIAQAAVERPFLIHRGTARGFEHKLHNLNAERDDVAVPGVGVILDPPWITVAASPAARSFSRSAQRCATGPGAGRGGVLVTAHDRSSFPR